MYFLSFIYPTHIISYNLSVFQAHFNDYCICTTLFPSLPLPFSSSLPLSAGFYKLYSNCFCCETCVQKILRTHLTRELATCLKHVSYSYTPHSLTLAELSFHICQNEIRVSFCQPLLSHSPAPPLSRSFTHPTAAAAAAAHNSINCPKLTVRQPFIYLSNPLCRRSLALSLSPSLSSLLLSYFIPLLLLLLLQRIRFM